MDTKNKIIGIAVDNYKLKKFKKTIAKNGFEILSITPLNHCTKLIRVDCPNGKIVKLKRTTEMLETFFKYSSNN